MKNLVGKLVLLERLNGKGDAFDYRSGEYLVIGQRLMILYCVKYNADVYSMHNLLPFIIEGTRAWKVVKDYDVDRVALQAMCEKVLSQIKAVMSGAKSKHWVESVYTSAENNIRSLQENLNLISEPVVATVQDSTITIGIRNGKLVIIP